MIRESELMICQTKLLIDESKLMICFLEQKKQKSLLLPSENVTWRWAIFLWVYTDPSLRSGWHGGAFRMTRVGKCSENEHDSGSSLPKKTHRHSNLLKSVGMTMVTKWRWFFYPNNSFTLAEMARPSANPANFLVAVPITLPMSFGPVAPTSAMMAFKATSSSSALICLGR